ncbi:unnamed protein product [Rotaria sp. Silwood1]|nr:unnamed protein product [Rotaria sp. Silwood1]
MNKSSHIPFENRILQECIRLSNVPLLSSIVKSYKKVKPLKDYTILNIQHELGDVSAQVEVLIVLGALPNNLYFLPSSYSHNKQFQLFLIKHFQIPKEKFFELPSYRLLNVIFNLNQMIQMELLKKQEKPNNLLVLDDGGCFSEALTILFAINDDLIEANELFDNLPLSLKICKFYIKLILSYLDSIEIRLVEQTSHDLIKRKLAEKDGFQIFNQLNNKDEFNYIIGCAGRCSLPMSSLSLLCNNSYLISVSSAAIEFLFHDMIQYALSKTSNKNLEICLPNDELNHLNDENIHRNIC